MPLAPQSHRRIDAPRAEYWRGVSRLLVLSGHLTYPSRRRRFQGTPRWRSLRCPLSGRAATLGQHGRPPQSPVVVCNDVCNRECV